MKRSVVLSIFLFFLAINVLQAKHVSEENNAPGFLFVSLNCENLFDCVDNALKDDDEFLPQSIRLWTYGRYWKKINHIGQEILSCGELCNGDIVVPDLVALCEIENDSVVFDLTRRSLLRNAGYEYFLTDSPDQRGINVALLYCPYTFNPLSAESIRVEPLKDMRPTRDILYVNGLIQNGDTLHVFVVHAPSRSGGEIETRPNRRVVAERLIQSVDSIRGVSPQANIIVAGDFNDYDKSPAVKYLVSNGLVDVSSGVKGSNGAKGTYKYQGEWGSLDHIFVSESQNARSQECFINDAPFLLCKDEDYGGVKPFRCYDGVRWSNGFSDHLPLVYRFVCY